MSMNPPERFHGSRIYQLYWCYQCHRTVRIASGNPSEIICPRCLGQFLYEIDINRPRLVVQFTEFDPSPEARLLEALSLMLDPPIRQPNRDLNWSPDVGIRAPWDIGNGRRGGTRRRQRGRGDSGETDDWGPESGILARPRTWVIVRPTGQPPERANPQPESSVPGGVDPRNYFTGQGLTDFIEELTQNDRPGPPPVPEFVINSLPTVKITAAHLVNDTKCPVCMDEFKVNGQARELPCKHIYHSECILPWLRLHNSCPVCRKDLPLPEDNPTQESDSDGSHERPQRCLRFRRLGAFWPFRSRYRPLNPRADNTTNTHQDESRWPSCSIL